MSISEAHEKYTRTATVLADIVVCQDRIDNDASYSADRSERANQLRALDLHAAITAHRAARDQFLAAT